MAGSYIKQFPELKSAINAEIKLAEKDKDFLEIKLSLADLNKIKNKFNISNNVLLSDAIKILKKLDLFVNIGKSNYDHKILAFILKDKNVILYVHNVNKLNNQIE